MSNVNLITNPISGQRLFYRMAVAKVKCNSCTSALPNTPAQKQQELIIENGKLTSYLSLLHVCTRYLIYGSFTFNNVSLNRFLAHLISTVLNE